MDDVRPNGQDDGSNQPHTLDRRSRGAGRSTRLGTLVGLLAAFHSTAALAGDVNEDVPPISNRPPGQDSVRRGVQGSAGMFNARIFLNINLSSDLVGKPVSIAPDLYYSVTDKLQLGLVHTGPMGWQTLPGSGLCLTGTDNGCPHVYNNLGLDFMYGLVFGDVFLSAHAAFYVLSFADPSATMLTLGLTGQVRLAQGLALFFDPQIGIGITGRDESTGVKEALFLPIELEIQATVALQLKVFTGISGALDDFGNTFQIPLGIGGLYNISTHFDVGLRFSFDNLLGHVPDGVGRADARSLSLLVAIRG
jgi:hypothetical protein